MKLDEIEKLCDEATPGPWTPVIGYCIEHDCCLYPRADEKECWSKKDKKFIAGARTYMPKLIRIARGLQSYRKLIPNDPAGLEGAIKALEELEK